jgi:hypothetical protein
MTRVFARENFKRFLVAAAQNTFGFKSKSPAYSPQRLNDGYVVADNEQFSHLSSLLSSEEFYRNPDCDIYDRNNDSRNDDPAASRPSQAEIQ